jgi:hypothetical protein
MLSTALWLMAITLESVLLVRAVQGKFLKHYRFFYLYLGVVFMRDLSLLPVYYLWPEFYGYAYWGSEFFSVLVGCGLVWEVYKVAFARYPGAACMARNVLPFLFVFAITRVFVKAWNSPNWIPGRTTLETERDLRIVQMALLIGLVAIFAYYAIPLGRNLKGIICGYGLFLVTSVVNLSLRDYLGDSFQRLAQYIQAVSYLLVLLVWCRTLWVYAPVPEPGFEPHLEVDYQSLVRTTREKLSLARTYLVRGMRT